MRHQWRDMWAFARKPVRSCREDATFPQVAMALAALMAILLLIEVFYFIPLLYIKEHFTDVVSKYANRPMMLTIIGGVLIAPVAEELINRAGLRKSWYLLLVGMPVVVGLMQHKMAGVGLGCVLVALAAYGQLTQKPGVRFRRGRAVIQRYPYLFWMFAAAFGVLHVDSYAVGGFVNVIVPLMLLSPLLGGLMLGYVRLRYGLLAAIALHIGNNAMACTLMFGFGVPY